jgi:hypothetical protein
MSDDRIFHGINLSPVALREILQSTTYADFFIAVEEGPHSAIPNGIGGDFLFATAPNGELE